VTQVDPAVDEAPPAHDFRNEQDKFNYEQCKCRESGVFFGRPSVVRVGLSSVAPGAVLGGVEKGRNASGGVGVERSEHSDWDQHQALSQRLPSTSIACPADIPDDPENFRDAPISLQVIGKKYEEEAVIR
jgi:hypothetical protein